MEYGINFNSDDANKNILSALEELDNTFFVENNSSSDEKNISDSDDISDSDKIEDLVENFNEMHLNNFEFVENLDNYIEDKFYDNLKLKVKELFEKKKCSCNSNCFEKIGYERFLKRRVEFESLDKVMRDMVVKGQLMAFQQEENTKKTTAINRKFSRFKYCFNNDLPICRSTYQALIGVGHLYLDNVIKHLRENGLEERIHGNTGNVPKNMNRVDVNYDVANGIFNFLKNYSDIHGLPSPGRNFNKISMPVVFLPTSYSYMSVYRDYVQAYKDEYGREMRAVAESTFHKIWKLLIPSLQFMSPKSDLCEKCETMKLEIQHTTQHEKKLSVTENYLAHLNRAKEERDYYNANITRAVEDGKCNPNRTESQVFFKTFEGSAHITYDWAQNVQVPYFPQQIGSLFFRSPRKVHLFGVCNTGNFPHTEQTNYVIDEGEMPDDGKLGKGVNCTLSLVWHAIQKYNRGEKKLVITCDNCVGQNKNNYSLFFYSWLIDRGLYEEIELNFIIPGHTKFICDSCFGLIKILYRKSRVNTVDDVTSIINRSTIVRLNTSQRYLNEEGFQYYNFKDFFQSFKKLPNVQKYHHFYFNSQHPGVVFYKDRLEDNYKEATIHNCTYATNILPSTISPRPLSLKRQEELYKEISSFVDLPFHDITCSKPNENETS
ncbi:hypothetical protein GLOIN_2v1484099 [Rhizophagus irregularis DAOM 181602=DAOM 197198]|uniref:DUF7869 domain-containing protein n=2 Tax=Rhizophagus irregularis TaxID=588596 RepID=A0A015KPY1_RHIIW|nr:hypothetical protein GLOIN_2v1484099 [Rhizophagus irregularis DAOM 181602=DAOM 197198]EXX61866.1 hypothetical protein RirG_167180 [Rhizophagus irregularis DAOM 197198w]POG64233.1 hypothetical protein GLOIN_2v1484099 [Rhizophagus irregularis DAOM 181602=DAOM 197198]GBC21316.2 hypothetical protein GLOIN_2v1484099 [Rhizophagus irregularis DAOM 181602=DAOM 197198]|eukprot:XP_025171099.1 hypothetical protein GLOIN_2v1484099 [Rhizophagus irregularis DAOM 181602=DAOM 197198]